MTKKSSFFSFSLVFAFLLFFSSHTIHGADSSSEEISKVKALVQKKKVGPKAVLLSLLWAKGHANLPEKLIQDLWEKYPEKKTLIGKPKPKKTSPISTITKEVLHGIFGGGLTATVLRKVFGPCKDDPLLQKGVVLIHATGASASGQWPAVQRWLREAGIRNVLSVDYDSYGPIKDSCAEVWSQIRERFSPAHRLILIGHSQGGLIARALVDHEECREADNAENPEISSVFCLNAPLHGSPMVDLLDFHKKDHEEYHQSYKDMAMESPFIKELQSGIHHHQFSFQKGIRIFEIASENDTFVHPSYAITGAPNTTGLVLSRAGHFTVAFDLKLWKQTIIPKIKEHYGILTQSPSRFGYGSL